MRYDIIEITTCMLNTANLLKHMNNLLLFVFQEEMASSEDTFMDDLCV